MRKASPKAIGAFVVVGLALLVAGLVTFGSVKFFAQRLPIVMYFEGNLSGLDEGAPLVFRGVRIGTITDVKMIFNTQTRAVRIPVYAEIEPERFVIEGRPSGVANMPQLIKDGLRAQLATQSILTGKLLVQVDLLPDTPVRLVGPPGEVPEVPTVPSAMAELQENVQDVLKKIQSMPLAELVQDLRTLVNDTDGKVRQVDPQKVTHLTDQANQTLIDLQTLIANVGLHLDDLVPSAQSALKNADRTILEINRAVSEARPLLASLQRAADSADRLLNTANGVIEPGSPAYRELILTLREFSTTARSIRGLADDLERSPNSILFGKSSTGAAK
jgi:paraquat-inducible protein B